MVWWWCKHFEFLYKMGKGDKNITASQYQKRSPTNAILKEEKKNTLMTLSYSHNSEWSKKSNIDSTKMLFRMSPDSAVTVFIPNAIFIDFWGGRF